MFGYPQQLSVGGYLSVFLIIFPHYRNWMTASFTLTLRQGNRRRAVGRPSKLR